MLFQCELKYFVLMNLFFRKRKKSDNLHRLGFTNKISISLLMKFDGWMFISCLGSSISSSFDKIKKENYYQEQTPWAYDYCHIQVD